VTDLLSGASRYDGDALLVEPHARSGKLRLVAAATAQRIAGLPTSHIAESGVPGTRPEPCRARRPREFRAK